MIPQLPSGFTHPLLIGEGAFSCVYRVRQTSLDRWVAIKIITERDSSRRKELLKEAKTQANIHLDCIPQVYDAFEWRKRICIIMQWLKGSSLRDILDTFPPAHHRYRIAESLISAVSSLHEQGYAHRDLKPENVFISPEYGVLLVDFGFTKSVINGQKSVSGVIKGTPAYMAPELWRYDHTVDPLKTDLYSLGKILKELFLNDSRFEILINSLLEDDPNKRPESTHVFLKNWNDTKDFIQGVATWKQIAGSFSSLNLSRKLFASAKELLFAHRADEAYWLLVECLEEDPDYQDAIEFMNRFPRSPQEKRKKIKLYLLSILSFISIFLIAFITGKHSQRPHVSINKNFTITYDKSALLLDNQIPRSLSTNAKLLDNTGNSNTLKGKIILQKYPIEGILLIDDNIIPDTGSFKSGFEYQYGTHLLKWKNTKGIVIWKEKINLLPFQTKLISIHYRVF